MVEIGIYGRKTINVIVNFGTQKSNETLNEIKRLTLNFKYKDGKFFAFGRQN